MGVWEVFLECGRGTKWPPREWKRHRVRLLPSAVRHTPRWWAFSQDHSRADEQAGDGGQPGRRCYQVVPWMQRRAKC